MVPTTPQRMSQMEVTKRPDGDTPMSSKKFIAYLIAELSWKAIIVLLVLSDGKVGDHLLMLTLVLTAGFLEVSYILGQAYSDRYLKIANAAMNKVDSTVDEIKKVV